MSGPAAPAGVRAGRTRAGRQPGRQGPSRARGGRFVGQGGLDLPTNGGRGAGLIQGGLELLGALIP